jgi:ribonuclease Z
VDCPSLDHIPSLIQQDCFRDPKVHPYTRNIIHILGDPLILKDPSYQSWMKQFPENCNHIIASNNYCSEHINFLSNSYMQYKLHQVDSNTFPLLYFNNEIKEPLCSLSHLLPKNMYSACNNLQIHMEPKERLDYSKVKENFSFEFIPDKIINKLTNNAKVIQHLKSCIEHWRQEHPFPTFPTASDIEIVTLGTGSALPSKYRNVSSTIILSKRNGNILLDAGEGTLGQISRHFGPEKTLNEILPHLKMIFISHIHADHHLGMMNLLSVMASLNRTSENPLYIIAPEKFNIWLEEYSVIQEIGLHSFIKVVPCYLLFNKFIYI